MTARHALNRLTGPLTAPILDQGEFPRGASMTDHNPSSQIITAPPEIVALVYQLYGLTEQEIKIVEEQE